jgi:flagellar biosynthesis regulator FlbT
MQVILPIICALLKVTDWLLNRVPLTTQNLILQQMSQTLRNIHFKKIPVLLDSVMESNTNTAFDKTLEQKLSTKAGIQDIEVKLLIAKNSL